MNSRSSLKFSVLVILGLFVAVACNGPKGNKPVAVRQTPNSGPAKTNSKAKVKAAEEAKVKAAEEAKVKAAEEAKVKAAEEAKVKAAEEAKVKAAEEAKVKAAEEVLKIRSSQIPNVEVDSSKIKTPREQSIQIQAKDVIQVRSLAKAANQLFQQVWSGYWKDKFSKVNSVFGMLNTVFKTKFLDNGFPIQSKVAITASCRDHDFEVEISSSVIDKEVVTPISYTLWELSCSGNTQARLKLAEITKGKGAQGIWGFQIQFANLSSTLGNGIYFFGKGSPSCEIYPSTDGRLQKMSCQGIGQNRDQSTFVQFLKFDFDLRSENPITGLGEVYKITQDGQKRLEKRIILKDLPRLNEFEFNVHTFANEPDVKPTVIAPPPPIPPAENLPTEKALPKPSVPSAVTVPNPAGEVVFDANGNPALDPAIGPNLEPKGIPPEGMPLNIENPENPIEAPQLVDPGANRSRT